MASNRNRSSSSLAPHPPLTEYYPTEEQRGKFLAAQFDHVAQDYDWISQVLSFGSGKRYRQHALKRTGLTKGKMVLDVACGPGTVSLCAQHIVGETGKVVGLDPSYGMVAQAQKQGVSTALQGKAEHLPFPDSLFDFISMGYALRHVSDLTLTFKEYLRVLKPDGKLLLLEISRPDSPLHYHVSRFFFKNVIPWVSSVGTKNPQARSLMQYYWETIEHCVPSECILQALEDSGFVQGGQFTLFGGLIKDYSARKPLTD